MQKRGQLNYTTDSPLGLTSYLLCCFTHHSDIIHSIANHFGKDDKRRINGKYTLKVIDISPKQQHRSQLSHNQWLRHLRRLFTRRWKHWTMEYFSVRRMMVNKALAQMESNRSTKKKKKWCEEQQKKRSCKEALNAEVCTQKGTRGLKIERRERISLKTRSQVWL